MSLADNQILDLPAGVQDNEPSQTYSIRGQTNTARLGEFIPIHYGRHVLWPDLIMTPYREYDGEYEWYHVLACAGVGKISTEQWKFGTLYLDTLAAADRQYETIYPGAAPTLVPSTVYTPTHSAIELTAVQSVGTVVNPTGTTVTRLAADIALNGLGYNNDSGTISSRTVTVLMEARTLDAAGLPTGVWTQVATLAISGATKETIRRTLKATVTAGRYDVRLNVSAAPSTDSKQMDKVIWQGVRGYNFTHPSYGNVTLVALRIKATALTAGESSQELSLIGTRWLKHWDGSAWTADQASRSIVWALADAYITICGLPQSTLDLPNLLAMHNKLTALGHQFDYRFDQRSSLLSALSTIARAGRCQLVQKNGVWMLVRDEANATIKGIFTPDNSKDFSISYQVAGYAEPDAIIGEYINPNTGQPKTLYHPIAAPARPESVRLAGITERAHAWDETVYLWRAAQRRRTGEFTTGLEGNTLLPQDVILVTADGTGWGSWGHIVSQSGADTVLSQRLPTTFTTGTLVVRAANGTQLGAYAITVNTDRVTVSGVPALSLPPTTNEPLYYIAVPTGKEVIQCRVTRVDPQQDDYVRIGFVVDGSAVYAAVPAIPNDVTASSASAALDIPWVRATGVATATGYDLRIAWGAVASASSYIVEFQPVGTTGWSRIYTGSALSTMQAVAKGQYNYRVAAVGATQGAWKSGSIEVGVGAALLPTPVVSLVSAFTGNALELTWPAIPNAAKYRVSIYTSAGTLKRTRDVSINNYRYTFEAGRDDASGRALLARVWAMDAAGNLSAGFGQVSATNPQIGAIAGITSTVAGGIAEITFTKPTDTDYAGLLVYISSTTGFAPATTNLFYDTGSDRVRVPVTPGTTKYIRFAAYDNWGRDALAYTAQYTLTSAGLGSANIADGAITTSKIVANAITSTQISDGAISTPKLQANAVTANQIAANAITATKIAADAINATHIQANAITASELSAGAVTATKIAADAVNATHIAAGAITASEIAVGAVGSGALAANSVTGTALAAGAVSTPKIATGAITTTTIAPGAITTGTIAANAISTDKIAANAVTATQIAAGSVTANKTSVANLSAIAAAIGTLTTGRLYNIAQTALFDLDATGTQAFISLKDAAGTVAFRVRANGDAYFKGTVEVDQLIANTAIIGTAMIQNGAISSNAGAESTTTMSIGGGTTTLQSVSVNGTGSGVCMVFVKARGSSFPGGSITGSNDIGWSQTPVSLSIDLLDNGSIVERAAVTATATPSGAASPNSAGAWSVSFFIDLPAWSGAKTLTLQARVTAGTVAVAGNSTKTSIRAFQWSK